MRNHEFYQVKSGGVCGFPRMVTSPHSPPPVVGRGQGGFTLIELLVVSAILGMLMTIAIPSYTKFVYTVKITRAVSELAGLERDIVAYQVDRNTLPDSLSDFGRGGLEDPWGNLYVYLKLPLISDGTARNDAFFDLNTEFDCYSKGLDVLTAVLTNDPVSADDVVRGGDGTYYGLAPYFR